MLLFLFLAGTLQAQEEIEDDVRYKKRVEKYISRWEKLIPHYTKLQFAGSMGMLSLGTGWNYYRNHWETDVYLGIVPRNSDRHAMATLTLKQNYYPWNIHIADKLSFEPLACGVYINTLLDRDFWGKQPDKYPQGYYWFSTRIRTHVFIGERFTLKLNTKKSWHKSIISDKQDRERLSETQRLSKPLVRPQTTNPIKQKTGGVITTASRSP